MSKWQDYESVWQNSEATGNDLLLLLALVKFRTKGVMHPTKETLAVLMNCNVDTVERSLKRLKRLGEVTWVRGSNRSKKANSYLILLPGLDKDTPADSPANSPKIPPQTHGKYPRNITPLNIKEIVVKGKLEFSSVPGSPFWNVVAKARPDLSFVERKEYLESFAVSRDAWWIDNAHTDEILLNKVLACFPSAEGGN